MRATTVDRMRRRPRGAAESGARERPSPRIGPPVRPAWWVFGWLLWVLVTGPAASGSPLGSGADGAQPPDQESGRIELGAARTPDATERARMARWHRLWRQETAPIEALLGPLGAAEQPARVGDPDWCRALARSLVRLDRERALPVPSRAAALHLRRALDRLTRGAAACLEGRFHASAYQIREAHGAFADAAGVLRPYGVRP